MNLSLTAHALTVQDICATLDKGDHTLGECRGLFIPWDTEINRALRRVDDLIQREEAKRDARHWSFSHYKLGSLKYVKSALGLGLLNISMVP